MTSQDGVPVPGSCTSLCLLEAVVCVLDAIDMLSPRLPSCSSDSLKQTGIKSIGV